MSKYNIGDKLNLKMVIDDKSNYEHLGFWVTSSKGNEEEGMWLTEEQLDEYSAKTYEQGLEDAWKFLDDLEHKIIKSVRKEVFGYTEIGDILDHYAPQEALAKLKSYEKEQEEI